MEKLTNRDFATKLDITESYASYLKSGGRLPRAHLLIKMIRTFDLDPNAAMSAYDDGPESFGAYLRREVFNKNAEKPSHETSPVRT